MKFFGRFDYAIGTVVIKFLVKIGKMTKEVDGDITRYYFVNKKGQ